VATDAGREGELIARLVFREAGITDISRVRRFWVSEALTKEVIRKSLETAKPWQDYNRIALEGAVRQQADWLIGINLTRYMTSGNNTLFSVGRVQTALLNAIATRNSEVARFTPVLYSELEAAVQSSNGTAVKAWLVNPKTGKTTFFDTPEYPRTAKAALREKAVDHTEATTNREIKKPEKLLNITALQKKAFRLHGYTPEKTLETAQALYEKHKCLSYPRTPSRVMGTGMWICSGKSSGCWHPGIPVMPNTVTNRSSLLKTGISSIPPLLRTTTPLSPWLPRPITHPYRKKIFTNLSSVLSSPSVCPITFTTGNAWRFMPAITRSGLLLTK
jgi:reverse gyrase